MADPRWDKSRSRTEREIARMEVRHPKQRARARRRALTPQPTLDDALDTPTDIEPPANDGWRWPWSRR